MVDISDELSIWPATATKPYKKGRSTYSQKVRIQHSGFSNILTTSNIGCSIIRVVVVSLSSQVKKRHIFLIFILQKKKGGAELILWAKIA